jgi:hypothetical protein
MARLNMKDIAKPRPPEVSGLAAELSDEMYKRMKMSVEDQLIHHQFDPVKNLVEIHKDKMTPASLKIKINTELLGFTKPKMANVTINAQQTIDLNDIVSKLDELHK